MNSGQHLDEYDAKSAKLMVVDLVLPRERQNPHAATYGGASGYPDLISSRLLLIANSDTSHVRCDHRMFMGDL